MKTMLQVLLLLCSFVSATAGDKYKTYVISDSLSVTQISEHAYVHVAKQNTPAFGKFTCNGLIYINGNEAAIMDTPPNEDMSVQLLDWMKATFANVKIKAVVINHFHSDCLGGLATFHKAGIPSYSYKLTKELAAKDGAVPPQNTFDPISIITIGSGKVYNKYFGEGHAPDNIVSWIPDERILFGGCMIKCLGAGKGNLSDANQKEWPLTVARVKNEFKNARIVIPGHGDWGGTKLLDYTIKMFQN